MKSNLTVATLMGYLQHHHKEKSSRLISKVISKLTKALSAVTGQLAALRKDIDLFKMQGYNPISYAPNRYEGKPMISSTSNIHLSCGGCKNMSSNGKFDFKIYGNCKVAFYCSKKSRFRSWNHHKNLFQTINHLEQQHLVNY